MTLHIHERRRYFNGVFGTNKAIVWHYILNKLPNTPLCFQWVSGNWPRSEGKHALVSACLGAQSLDSSSVISGTIRDPSGVGLAGSRVDLVQENGYVEQTTATDNAGSFRFENVAQAQGPHFVDVKEPGFKPVRQAIRLGARPLSPMRIVLVRRSKPAWCSE
jgi:hypothetical protein